MDRDKKDWVLKILNAVEELASANVRETLDKERLELDGRQLNQIIEVLGAESDYHGIEKNAWFTLERVIQTHKCGFSLSEECHGIPIRKVSIEGGMKCQERLEKVIKAVSEDVGYAYDLVMGRSMLALILMPTVCAAHSKGQQ